MTVTEVHGRTAREECRTENYRGLSYAVDLTPKVKLELVVPDHRANQVVDLVMRAARTGRAEAGTIFVSALEDVIRIRTGEHGDVV